VGSADLSECSFLIPLVRNSDRLAHEPVVWRDYGNELRKMSKDFSGPQRVPIMPFVEVESVPGECESVVDESRRYFLAVPEDRF